MTKRVASAVSAARPYSSGGWMKVGARPRLTAVCPATTPAATHAAISGQGLPSATVRLSRATKTKARVRAGPHPVRYIKVVANATWTAIRTCHRRREGAVT